VSPSGRIGRSRARRVSCIEQTYKNVTTGIPQARIDVTML
jgi:hypothetical protein